MSTFNTDLFHWIASVYAAAPWVLPLARGLAMAEFLCLVQILVQTWLRNHAALSLSPEVPVALQASKEVHP